MIVNSLVARFARKYLLIFLGFISLSLRAQLSVGVDSVDFVRASIMIASPNPSRLQSSFGHMFLRMQCPSLDVDYCFSFESDDHKVDPFSIFTGNYDVRLVRVQTAEYLNEYACEHRLVTAYPLNLTLHEEQRLWQRLDEIQTLPIYPKHDYFHHGCSQELTNIIRQSLDGALIFDESALPYGSTIQVLGTNNLPIDSWVLLCSQFFSLDATDNHLPPAQRFFMPVAIPDYLHAASIRDRQGNVRPFVDEDGVETLLADTAVLPTPGFPIWARLLIILIIVLLIGILEWFDYCPHWLTIATNALLFTIYTAFSAFLVLVYSLSTLPTTSGWSWVFLAYNLIPFAVYLLGWYKRFTPATWARIYGGYTLYTLLFMLIMACVGDHFSYVQYLLLSIFTARCACLSINGSLKKQTK